MWADTLQALERAHLLRLGVWGALSMLAGTAMLAWLRVGARESALLRHFAMQVSAWGVVLVAIAAGFWARIEPRDLSSATRLDRFLWLNIGLDVGYVLVGATLLVCGWKLGKRLGLVGAAIGILVQGSALLLLDLLLAAQISR